MDHIGWVEKEALQTITIKEQAALHGRAVRQLRSCGCSNKCCYQFGWQYYRTSRYRGLCTVMWWAGYPQATSASHFFHAGRKVCHEIFLAPQRKYNDNINLTSLNYLSLRKTRYDTLKRHFLTASMEIGHMATRRECHPTHTPSMTRTLSSTSWNHMPTSSSLGTFPTTNGWSSAPITKKVFTYVYQ